jgi:uncharacterized membrane protein YfcA
VVEYFVIPAVALLASLLTFFSGFGLGTILLAAAAIFFPVNIAVALTAIVHLLNSIFILSLKVKHVDRGTLLRFGLAAVLGSIAGAWLLSHLTALKPLFTYYLLGHSYNISPIKLVVSVLIIFFALWETLPRLRNASFNRKYMPFGGLLSGFFGGLSGLQGALRSAFLVRSGLQKDSYIATSSAVAILVDIPRITIYSTNFSLISTEGNTTLLVAAIAAGFAGTLLGNLWLKKITMNLIQVLVSIMLFIIGLALGGGFI